MFGVGGRSGRCSRAHSARCHQDTLVMITSFAGFLVVKERLFGWFCSGRYDGVSQSGEKIVVLSDEKKYLRHTTGIDDQ